MYSSASNNDTLHKSISKAPDECKIHVFIWKQQYKIQTKQRIKWQLIEPSVNFTTKGEKL